jgi:DNA invertase Pin-like site-specific DNA recombinase
MKTTAYLRISTVDQDIEKNKSDILKLANEKRLGYVEFIEENEAKKDDVIIVSELSRLGRSMLEIMEILSIATQKQLKIYSVKGDWHLDGSIQSKVMAMVFSMASEIERDLISSRTKEALRFKKENGIKLGRPKGPGKSKLDKFKPEIEALLSNGSTQKFIANRYNTTEANLYNWMKRHNLKKS